MTTCDKPLPVTKPQQCDGNDVVLPVVAPNHLGGTTLPFIDAGDYFASSAFPWQQAEVNDAPTRTPWGTGNPVGDAITAAWKQADAHGFSVSLDWGRALENARKYTLPWRQANANETQAAFPWQQFVKQLAIDARLPWIAPGQHEFSRALPWATFAAYAARKSMLWKRLGELGAQVRLPWGAGGQYITSYPLPYSNPPDATNSLAFPDLPVYIMIPSITAVVISTGADLAMTNVRIDGDVDSFCWSFEGQIPPSKFPLVNPENNPDPVEIRVTVNGFPASFIVESYSDNRKWGARTYTIRGRSRSAMLSGDFAPTRTLLEASDYNIAQLADHELTSTGWTSIWDAVDFLVPGGTFTYSDLAPIAAMQQLAASLGATIETDMDALNIHAKPRYTVPPWQWPDATPDIVIPAAILSSAGGDWQGGANPNGIYVYPQNSTSGAFVRITGSGGVDLMPMVVDPLLVDSGAQAARGTQELAKAGRSKREQIVIPLFPAPALPSLVPLRSLVLVQPETTGTTQPSTTTTANFTITAVASTQSIAIASVAGLAVDDYVIVDDGTHSLIGRIMAISGLSATVRTDHIYIGSAGNTMASGAAVKRTPAWLGQVMANSITASKAGDAVTVRQTLTVERQFRE